MKYYLCWHSYDVDVLHTSVRLSELRATGSRPLLPGSSKRVRPGVFPSCCNSNAQTSCFQSNCFLSEAVRWILQIFKHVHPPKLTKDPPWECQVPEFLVQGIPNDPCLGYYESIFVIRYASHKPAYAPLCPNTPQKPERFTPITDFPFPKWRCVLFIVFV